LSPGSARGQSAWARGDAAFRKGDWARAESLYARRARLPRPPAALLADLAAARAQRAEPATADSVERLLSHLAARDDAAGTMSGYNLGTLLGRKGDVNHALAELRRALERSPDDADARWNYEWLRRQQDDGSRPQSPKPDPAKPNDKNPPRPQDPKAGQGAAESVQPPPSAGQSQSQQAQAPPAPGTQQPMTRRQAEQLLGSLGDLERTEQRGRHREGSPHERRGKDW
jgi:tetratricopeptide (TPR) repeat protein